MAAKPEKGIWLRKLVLAIWGLLCFLPILFFAKIALRPRNEIIAPQPIYFPTLTIETWAKILEEWPLLAYFKNSVMAIGGSVFICLLLGIPAAYALDFRAFFFDRRIFCQRKTLRFLALQGIHPSQIIGGQFLAALLG